MSEITLVKKQNNKVEPLIIHLQDEKTGETITHKYFVKRLGGKAAMQSQILTGEFARDKRRDEIVGSSLIKEILNNTTKATEKTPDLVDIFDYLDNEGLKALVEKIVMAAKSSTVDSDNEHTQPEPTQPGA